MNAAGYLWVRMFVISLKEPEGIFWYFDPFWGWIRLLTDPYPECSVNKAGQIQNHPKLINYA